MQRTNTELSLGVESVSWEIACGIGDGAELDAEPARSTLQKQPGIASMWQMSLSHAEAP